MSLLLVYQVSDSEIFVVSDVAIIGFVVTDQAAVVALVVGVDAGGLGEVGSLNVPVAVRATITFDESAVANQQGGGSANLWWWVGKQAGHGEAPALVDVSAHRPGLVHGQ